MPWVMALLHGQKVFARALPDGSLAREGERVEVAYSPKPARLYKARVANLVIEDRKVLPDEACATSAVAAAAKARPSRAPSKASKVPPAPIEGAIIVYADGACSGNPGPAGAGVVIVDGACRTELSEYLGNGTNNIAELCAIERAIEEAGEREKVVVIHTDSAYSIGVLSKGWKAKANQALIERIKKKLDERGKVKLVHVPGHAGVELNERADELAREAVRTRASRKQTLTG